jgi:N-acyl-D-amino-acid deacylase
MSAHAVTPLQTHPFAALQLVLWLKLTAANFGFTDRGVIREGAYADITVFDANTIDDATEVGEPCSIARGIQCVIVNGSVAWRSGDATGTRTGRLVRRAQSNGRAPD